MKPVAPETRIFTKRSPFFDCGFSVAVPSFEKVETSDLGRGLQKVAATWIWIGATR